MGCCNLAVSVSEPDEFHHLLQTLYTHFDQPFQRHTLGSLLYTHPFPLLQRVEQINQLLVVNLQNWTSQLLLSLANEDLLQSTRNYTEQLSFTQFTKHSKCFARTCLSVGENSRILPPEESINVSTSHCREHISLSRLLSENRVERVSILSIINHGGVMFESCVIFGRTKTTENANVLSLFLFLVSLTLTVGVLVKSRLYQGLRQLDCYFRDWTV